MSRISTSLACVAVLVLGLLVLGAPAANAATRIKVDSIADPTGVPDRLDIKRVRWDNGADTFRIKVSLQRVRTQKTVIFADMLMSSFEGYPVEARSWWRDGQRIDRLWWWGNSVSKTRIPCPQMSSRWHRGVGGFVELSIPQSCMFGGWPWEALRVLTIPANRELDGTDYVVSNKRLAQD